jgi:ubiquitin carboxyl-terminal hydrolase 14
MHTHAAAALWCLINNTQGREADGGHYMGWVRQQDDDWLVYDDADVSPCKTEDIMKLNGGGDWHMAYLAFYRYKD